MIKPNCSSCIHVWTVLEGDEKTLQCRRYPPKVFPIAQKNRFSDEVRQGSLTIYPPVSEDMFCGEYRELEIPSIPIMTGGRGRA